MNPRSILTTLAEILGVASVSTGVAFGFGWPYALIVAGIAVFALGVIQG